MTKHKCTKVYRDKLKVTMKKKNCRQNLLWVCETFLQLFTGDGNLGSFKNRIIIFLETEIEGIITQKQRIYILS